MKFLSLALLLLLSTSLSAAHESFAAQDASVQRTKSCPSGSELVGKQCVTTQLIEPQLVCPAGTILLNGECATFARANRVCSKGSTLSSDRCISTEVIPASYVCNEGELQGKQCRITTEVPPVCPAGLQQRDGQCVRFTPQQKVCTDGYQLQGKECVQRLTFAAVPTCSADFSLTGNKQCSKTVPLPPFCSNGFALVNGECVKEVSKVPAPCPQSFAPVGVNGCQRIQQSPVRPVCSNDFILDEASRQCVQEIPVPPTCPAGTSRGQSAQCERPVAKVPVCDSVEELVGGRCRRASHFPSELQCAQGYSLVHDKCKKATTQNPVPRCSVGVLKNGQCVTESSSSPLLQCPAGYQLAKGPKCIRDVTYDCSKTVTKTECEMPAFVAQIAQPRQLHGDYKAKPIEQPVSSKKTPTKESKTPRCAQVSQVVPQSCTKSESAPIQYVCADGSAPIGKNCPVFSSTPTEPYCTAGQYDKATGQCVTIDVKPSNRICSIGQLQADTSCLQVDEKPATLICPQGSQPSANGCVVVQPEIVHPNRVVRRAPQEVCDFGVKQGKVCVEVEKVPRAQVCPSNSQERDSRCVLTTEVTVPKPLSVVRPAQYVCADGAPAQGKSCFSQSVVPAEYVCRDGGVKEGQRCVHTADLIYQPARVTHTVARPTCPQGFELQRDQCKLTTSQPAELQCPSNFIRYNDGAQECTRPHQRIQVCPAGTQKSESKGSISCVKKTYAPPQVTEIKVCTKGQPGC